MAEKMNNKALQLALRIVEEAEDELVQEKIPTIKRDHTISINCDKLSTRSPAIKRRKSIETIEISANQLERLNSLAEGKLQPETANSTLFLKLCLSDETKCVAKESSNIAKEINVETKCMSTEVSTMSVVPLSMKHFADVPLNIKHVAGVPLNIKHVADVPLNIKHVADMALNIKHVADVPLSIEHVADIALNIKHVADVPLSITPVADVPLNIKHVAGVPLSITHVADVPLLIKHVPSPGDFQDKVAYEKFINERTVNDKFDIQQLPNGFNIPNEHFGSTCLQSTQRLNENVSYLLMPEGSEDHMVSLYSPLPPIQLQLECINDDAIRDYQGVESNTPIEVSHSDCSTVHIKTDLTVNEISSLIHEVTPQLIRATSTKSVRFDSPLLCVKEFMKDDTYISSEGELDDTLPVPYEPRNTVPYYNDDINEQVVPSFLCEELELEPNTVVEDNDIILSPPIANCKLSPPIASFKHASDIQEDSYRVYNDHIIPDCYDTFMKDVNNQIVTSSPIIPTENDDINQKSSPLVVEESLEIVCNQSSRSPYSIEEDIQSMIVPPKLIELSEAVIEDEPLNSILDNAMHAWYHSYITACYVYSDLLIREVSFNDSQNTTQLSGNTLIDLNDQFIGDIESSQLSLSKEVEINSTCVEKVSNLPSYLSELNKHVVPHKDEVVLHEHEVPDGITDINMKAESSPNMYSFDNSKLQELGSFQKDHSYKSSSVNRMSCELMLSQAVSSTEYDNFVVPSENVVSQKPLKKLINADVDEIMCELMLSQAVRTEHSIHQIVKPQSNVDTKLSKSTEARRRAASVVPDMDDIAEESEEEEEGTRNQIYMCTNVSKYDSRDDNVVHYESVFKSRHPNTDDSVVPNNSFILPTRVICTPQKVRVGLSKKTRTKTRLHPYHNDE